jgi:hypothetical protein
LSTFPRHLLALGLSLIAHAAPVLWGELSFLGSIDMPEFDIEFTEVELVDPDMIQGEAEEAPEAPPVLEPQPPEGPPLPEDLEDGEGEEEPAEEEEEPEEPKRNLAEGKSDIDALGPESSTYFVLLVPRRIRKLGFREKAMDIMAPLPDFEYLITKGGFDPLRDFDHIMLASSDLRDWRQTFLAVDYNLERREIKAGIERAAAANGESIDWIEENGIIRGNPQPIDPETPDIDNRWFVLLDNGIAVYVLPQFVPYILGEKEVGDAKTSGNFVGNLTRLKRFAARQPTAGLHFVATDLRSSIKRTRNIPFELPDRIELLAEAESSPELLLTLGFDTMIDAKAFEQWWTQDVAKHIDGNLTMKLTVKPYYEMLEIVRDGKNVRLWAQFSQDQTEQILGLIADGVVRGLKKSPEEIEAARQQRIERWKARKGGKLPPSALHPATDDEDAAAGASPSAPTQSEPAQGEDEASGDVSDRTPAER